MVFASWLLILLLALPIGLVLLIATNRQARRLLLWIGLGIGLVAVGLFALFVLRAHVRYGVSRQDQLSVFTYPPELESNEPHGLGPVAARGKGVVRGERNTSIVINRDGISATSGSRSVHVSSDGSVEMSRGAFESESPEELVADSSQSGTTGNPSPHALADKPPVAPEPHRAAVAGSATDEWIDASQADFQADVYPSERSAAVAAARQIVKAWDRILPAGQEPTQVLVSGDSELEPNVVPAVLLALRAKLGDDRVEMDKTPHEEYLDHFEKVMRPYLQRSQGNAPSTSAPAQLEADAAVRVLVKGDFSYAYGGKGVTPSLKKGGTIELAAAGPVGMASRSTSFENKTWVENGVDRTSQTAGHEQMVARSRQLCPTRRQAEQEAVADAADKVMPLVRAALERIESERNNAPSPGIATIRQIRPDAELRNTIRSEMMRGRGVSDHFTQQLRKPYGSVWQHAVLIDASDAQITQYAQTLLPEIIRERQVNVRMREAWMRTGVGIVLMTILIAVVYAFLNAATRGYYTWMLRGTMVVLVLAGAALLLFVA